MSLKLDRVYKGITIADAIARIDAVAISKSRDTVTMEVRWYATDAEKLADQYFDKTTYILVPPTKDTYFAFLILDELGKNSHEQAYIYLKTLPEFAGAVDC